MEAFEWRLVLLAAVVIVLGLQLEQCAKNEQLGLEWVG